jgi:hypothetical protein
MIVYLHHIFFQDLEEQSFSFGGISAAYLDNQFFVQQIIGHTNWYHFVCDDHVFH